MSKKSSNQHLRYEVITQQDDNGDLIIPLPPNLLEELGWKEGDDIKFDFDDKGRFILTKVYK
jgi:bifunctional DNA-binding transcriptional regulator/antitoxin component of YhaV-PrlF toxin-antitoxin module